MEEKWIDFKEQYPPENKRVRFRLQYMFTEFECEGTAVYRNNDCYRDKCFSDDSEIREMFYRSKCIAWMEVEDKMKSLNMNSQIKVKLNPYGVEIYYHKLDEVNKLIKSNSGEELERRMPRIDKDGFTEFTLWDFIHTYGEYLSIGKKEVLVNNRIYFSEDELENVD